MSQHRGKMGLMALVMLLPFAVIIGVMRSGRGRVGHLARNGGTSGRKRVSRGADGRRLQSSSTSYDFATQLEMTVCLTTDHTTDSATVSTDQFKSAVVSFFDLSDPSFVNVDGEVTRCGIDSWQRRVSVYNTASDTESAADVASNQVDSIYPNTPDPKTTNFFEKIVTSITAEDSELTPVASDFNLESLGFLVIWLDSTGDVVSTQGTTTNTDVVTIGGTEIWWPWWAWLIYAAVVLCCICPMLFFFFKWRRDKEAETETYGGTGKDLGSTPAAPSATSSNPYGGNFPSGEEFKNGKN